MIVWQQNITIKVVAVSLLLTSLVSGVAWGSSPSGFVNYTRGVVFAIENGKTRMIHKGDNIFPGTELITEVGGQLSYTDYFDHRYHLAGSGHLLVKKGKGPVLKRGYLWIQSHHRDASFMVETANSKLSYRQGEAVIYFDPAAGKSQAVVLKGEMQFVHLLHPHLFVSLREGEFSQLVGDPTKKDAKVAYPRNPTKVGYQSFRQLISLFDGAAGVESMQKAAKQMGMAKRKIASVPAKQQSDQQSDKKVEQKAKPKGRIIYWKSTAVVPTKENKADSFIRVFGSTTHSSTQEESKPASARAPASSPVVSKEGPQSSFEHSLQKHSGKQRRHSREVNRLIDDLKSYSQDYRQEY